MWAAMDDETFTSMTTQLHASARQAASQLELYGLAEWSGPVMLGEWAGTDGRTDRVGLLFGSPSAAEDPCVEVHTLAGESEPVVAGLRYGDASKAVAGAADDEVPALRRAAGHRRTGTEEIIVSGKPVPFTVRTGTGSWYGWATAPGGSTTLIVEAAGLEPAEVELTRIHDLQPYLDGHLDYLRSLRG